MSDESTPTSVVVETPVVQNYNSGSVETHDVTPVSVSETSITPEVEVIKDEAPKEKIAPTLSKLKEREFKAAEREAEAERKLQEAQDTASRSQEISQKLEALKTNPSKVLSELGISFNDLAKAMLDEEVEGDSTPSELDAVKQSLNDIQAKLQAKEDEERRALESSQDAQIEAAVSRIKGFIDEAVNDGTDRFELIRLEKCQDLVLEILHKDYLNKADAIARGDLDADGNPVGIINYLEACKLAENYLYEERKAMLLESKKMKELLTPQSTPKPQKTSFGKTLSSQATEIAAATSMNKPDYAKMSHDERIKTLSKTLRFN